MAQSPLSMFDVQPQLSYADQARQQQQAAMQYAQLSGPQQSSYNMFQTAAGMAQPVADLASAGISAAQGQPVDNPQAKLQNIRAKVQAALRGVDATDPTKVYPVMIQVLQQEGMVSQAMALQKEYEDITNKRRDDERAQKKDQSLADYHQKLIDSRDPRSPLSKSIDAYQALVAKRNALPEGSPERAAADQAVNAYEAQLLQKDKVMIANAGDRVQVLNANDGSFIRDITVGAKPASAGAKAAPVSPQPMKDAYGAAMVDATGNQVYTSRDGSLWTLGQEGWQPAAQPGANLGRDKTDRALKAPVQKLVAESNTIVGMVDQAIAELQANKNDVGAKAYLNKIADLLDRWDTPGVGVRALVTDIGSNVVHQRSGAAVSAQEFDRLRGVIPQPTDNAATAIAKLSQLRNGAIRTANALRKVAGVAEQSYSAPAPATRATAPSAAPTDLAAAAKAELANRGIR